MTLNSINSIANKNEYKVIMGGFIKYHRVNDGISLNYVADCLKMNKGYLSEAENGIRKLSEKHYENIMNYYDIKFNFDEEILIEIRKYMFLIYEAYINLDENLEIDYLDLVISNEDKYLNSYAFFSFNLVKLFKLVRNKSNQSEITNLTTLIKGHIHMYTDDEKAIFYDVLALNSMYNLNYKTAYSFLELSINELKINHQVSGLKGIILYHMSVALQHLNNSSLALEYCEYALDEFRKYFCYHRVYYLDMYKGNCLSRLKRYKEAEDQYLNLLKNILFIEDFEFQSIIYDNLSWNSLKAKEFEKSIKYANKSISLGSSFSELAINIPYALYKLGDNISSLTEIDKILDKSRDDYVKVFLNSLKYFLLKEEEKFISYSTEFYQLCNLKQDYEMEIIILKLFLDFYKEQNNIKCINIIQEKIIEYYERD